MAFREFALIVAGGKGTRFGGTIPKQFVTLKGKPVVMHAIEAFYRYSENIQVILVLPGDEIPMWQNLAQNHGFKKDLIIQEGGHTRFQSVKNGLARISGEGHVAIHDGARPLVSTATIASSFQLAKVHGTAVTAVALKESLRLVVPPEKSQALDRSQYRIVQTPQTFEVTLIRKAYEIPEDETLTDDASVAERSGFQITLLEGDYRNIKITNHEDLAVAETFLSLSLSQ